MMLKGVGARILADDIPVLYDFYTEKLGFKVYWGDRDGSYVSFGESDSDKPAFAIFLKSGMKEYPEYAPLPEQPKADHVVYCTGADDVDVVYEELKAKGVEFMSAPRNMPGWFMRCVYFRDPEGNLFEISSEIKE